jgi:hypothetical protein
VRLELLRKRLAALEQETIRARTMLYQQQGIVGTLEKAVGLLRSKPERTESRRYYKLLKSPLLVAGSHSWRSCAHYSEARDEERALKGMLGDSVELAGRGALTDQANKPGPLTIGTVRRQGPALDSPGCVAGGRPVW